MSQKILLVFLIAFASFQISKGQTGSSVNENPFLSGVEGVLVPKLSQDFSSSVPVNKEKNDQIQSERGTSFSQGPSEFRPFGSLSTISSTSEGSPSSDLSPIEIFISEFNSTVHSSKILQDIFDLRELSPEAFSNSLYDYVYENCVEYAATNPNNIASLVAFPIKDEIDSFTLPIMLDIYGNSIAKYLFAKGSLNSSNASSLAKKLAETLEDNAQRSWRKENPESKFLVLESGYVDYMKSIKHFYSETFEDLANSFATEVKRVAAII